MFKKTVGISKISITDLFPAPPQQQPDETKNLPSGRSLFQA
jgi:hypothetical protein